jgi:hypothetical protein
MLYLSRAYDSIASLIYNVLVIFIIYHWIKIKLKVLIFLTSHLQKVVGRRERGGNNEIVIPLISVSSSGFQYGGLNLSTTSHCPPPAAARRAPLGTPAPLFPLARLTPLPAPTRC